jgi:hypothetical protein
VPGRCAAVRGGRAAAWERFGAINEAYYADGPEAAERMLADHLEIRDAA